MRRSIVLLGAMLGVAACGQEEAPAGNTANTAAAEKPKPRYCFFKDNETKDWAASRDAQGNVVIKGKAYRSDPRYQARLGEPDVSGVIARIAPSIAPNTTGFGAPENWWDVSATIPNSAGVESVVVECGPKTLAVLKVAPAKA